jgi:hypothetical protein
MESAGLEPLKEEQEEAAKAKNEAEQLGEELKEIDVTGERKGDKDEMEEREMVSAVIRKGLGIDDKTDHEDGDEERKLP